MKRLKNDLYINTGAIHGALLAVYILTSILINALVIAGNDYIAVAADMLLAGAEVELGRFLLPFIAITVTGSIAAFVNSKCGNDYSAAVSRDIRKKLGSRLLELPYSYYDEKGTGSIMTKLVSDIGEVGRFFSEIMPNLIVDVITVLTASVYLWQMDAMLIIVLFVTVPPLLIASDRISRRLTSVAKKRRDSIDARTQTAYDAVSGIEVVRSYTLDKIMLNKISYYIDDVSEQKCKSTKITSMGFVLKHIVNTVPVIICYMFALNEMISGMITAGDMLAFSVMFSRVVRPLSNLVFCMNDIREINVSLKRVKEIYDERPEQSGAGKFEPSVADGGVIEWEDLTFSYDNKRNVLNRITFKINKGETVAFAGGSGEGKSTIFRILCGFYRKKSGIYKLFGHEYDEWDIGEARKHFSYVSQNVFLFPESIWKNVAYGREGASREDVIEACKMANIHDFITALPQGYDTPVGERGARLSGGERQRISIARAFLKDAPVLLLDEPTAAVDSDTEELISQAVANISKGRTVIIIAHRLSTIMDADRIYVVEKGRIAEEGTHDELIRKNGIYAGMHGKEAAQIETA